MIRVAEEKDLNAGLELLKEFHAESMNRYNLICEEELAQKVMRMYLNTSFVLEIDNKVVGVLGGTIVNYPLNNELIYQEWIWFVTKKYRLHGISLYRALEDYCRINNIKKIVMVSMANSKADKLEDFYIKLGFELLEKHYIKNLN